MENNESKFNTRECVKYTDFHLLSTTSVHWWQITSKDMDKLKGEKQKLICDVAEGNGILFNYHLGISTQRRRQQTKWRDTNLHAATNGAFLGRRHDDILYTRWVTNKDL